ncbi:hypothetical protein [Micromonospora carbonacea]|uniref:hypothetical protein n=1 Tax=Micromonospora carbonacea TaxID=47853 RepID=UPI00371E5284
MSILDRIDATLHNLCPCGAAPRTGSPYCSADCEPTHIAEDTDTSTNGHYATPMRWRPDLVTATDDSHLIPATAFGDPHGGYTGPHNANVYKHRDRPGMWHLRLDDGHRYVGLDITEDELFDAADFTALMRDRWARLERELGNTRHLEPDDHPARCTLPIEALDRWVNEQLMSASEIAGILGIGDRNDPDDPWADVMGYPTRLLATPATPPQPPTGQENEVQRLLTAPIWTVVDPQRIFRDLNIT